MAGKWKMLQKLFPIQNVDNVAGAAVEKDRSTELQWLQALHIHRWTIAITAKNLPRIISILNGEALPSHRTLTCDHRMMDDGNETAPLLQAILVTMTDIDTTDTLLIPMITGATITAVLPNLTDGSVEVSVVV